MKKLTPTEKAILLVLLGGKIGEIENHLKVLSNNFYPDAIRILSSDLEQLKIIKGKLLWDRSRSDNLLKEVPQMTTKELLSEIARQLLEAKRIGDPQIIQDTCKRCGKALQELSTRPA